MKSRAGSVACLLLLPLAVLTIGMGRAYFPQSDLQLSLELPPPREVLGKELACEALLSASIWEDADNPGQLTVDSGKGTDKLALKLDRNVLKLITQASVEVGRAEPAQFRVIEQTDDYVMAVHHTALGEAIYPSLNSLVLNKRNGLATWTKNRPYGFPMATPEIQSFYLACH